MSDVRIKLKLNGLTGNLLRIYIIILKNDGLLYHDIYSDDVASLDITDFHLLMSAEEKSVVRGDATSPGLLCSVVYQGTIDLIF